MAENGLFVVILRHIPHKMCENREGIQGKRTNYDKFCKEDQAGEGEIVKKKNSHTGYLVVCLAAVVVVDIVVVVGIVVVMKVVVEVEIVLLTVEIAPNRELMVQWLL